MGRVARGESGVDILTGDPKKAIKYFTVPIAIALFLQQGNNMVDTLWVTALGSSAMAALGVVMPLYSIILAVGNGISVGTSVAIARNIGMKHPTDAERVAAQSIMISFVSSAVLATVLLLTARPLLVLLGAGNAIESATDFALPLYISSFVLMTGGLVAGLLRGEGAAKKAMYTQIALAITNLILDPVFIYVLDMGVAGAAWATVVACLVSTLLGFQWYIRGKTFIKIRFREMRPSKPHLKQMMGVGLPQIAESTAVSMFNMFLNFCIVVVGSTGLLAIYAVVWRIIYMVIIPAQAVSGAVVSACSAEYGMRRYDMISRAFSYSVKFSILSMLALSLLTAIFADPISAIFTHAPDMKIYHSELLTMIRILMVCVPVFSLVFVGSALLQAVSRATVSMWSSIIRNAVISVAFAIVAFTVKSTTDMWIALAAVEIFGGLLMWYLAQLVLRNLSKRDAPVMDFGTGENVP